jgi:hypothetical protein
MNGRGTLAALAAALAIAFAGAASAQQSDRSGEPSRARNLYVGVALGQSTAKEACSGLADCKKSDNSFGAFAGYWFNPAFALEGGYHNLGKATAPGGTYVRSNVWELLALGAWRPHASVVSLYTKFGLARGAQEGGGARAAPKELTTGITFGFGVQVDLARRFGVRAEWQRYPRLGGGPVLPTGDIDVLRLAGVWRFQ